MKEMLTCVEKPLNRSKFGDNIKGVLILLVVFAHFLYGFQEMERINAIVDSIYMFHMPAFVFMSGYFSKSKKAQSLAGNKKLIVAYLLVNGAFLLKAAYKGNIISITVPAYSMWYLLALVAWRITLPTVEKMGKVALPVLGVAALFVGFCSDITNAFSLRRIVAFYPFFYAGYILSKEQMGKFEKLSNKGKIYRGIPLALLMCAMIVVGHYLFNITNGQMMMVAYSKGIDFFARIYIFITAAIAILFLLTVGVEAELPFLTKMGKYSLPIFLAHRPITLIVQNTIKSYFEGITEIQVVFVAVAGTLAVCCVFGRDGIANAVDSILSLGEGRKTWFRRVVTGLLIYVVVLCTIIVPTLQFLLK